MWRFLRRELARAVVRLAAALVIYELINRLPWPAALFHWVALSTFAALAASVLVICGKLLYDTLFYDHFWRQVDGR